MEIYDTAADEARQISSNFLLVKTVIHGDVHLSLAILLTVRGL